MLNTTYPKTIEIVTCCKTFRVSDRKSIHGFNLRKRFQRHGGNKIVDFGILNNAGKPMINSEYQKTQPTKIKL